MRFNFTTHSAATTTPAATATTTASARSNEKSAKPLNRPKTIEEDPDSLDSVISNPQSYPITIVPNRPASFYGLSSNGKAFQRQPSCRSRNFRPGSMRRVRRRAVFKNGDCNVVQKHLQRRRVRFLQDMYTTMVDWQWRWTLLAFALSFILSWLFFALIWWLIMYTHGDLEELHLPHNQEDSGWAPCVSAIDGFTSCFLFSIETQHTIGYGVRTTSPECPEAIFMMCFQSIFGVMSSAFMAGIVFAKMTRAKQRAQTLLFSKHAVICQRDGCLSLMFRVGDMRKSHIIGAGVRAQLIRTRSTKEGEVMTQHFTELQIGTDDSGSDLFFIWPMVIEHRIDENSPLYNMNATDMLQDKFEIVVILEGTVESTGQSTQARSSYINTEILWGHRFDPVVLYNKDLQAYEIDYARFNETTQVDTPLCSARELNEIYKIQEGFRTPASVQLRSSPNPSTTSAHSNSSGYSSWCGNQQLPRRLRWQLSLPLQRGCSIDT
ncbi:G protein-activated inward rectifier potassium channel 3 isoform X1 [Drosophila hydei]|uniref:G protein-activated inward rectifier potassium channel 3 isoform X1 n=1 Tax=Drosophila hydei TaxID=7224 RepID=A0A6J1MGG7_DROHY|nr:G protein-activated inward rectifier potassium channel 3 isoform X1 [Drosophila hydei]XP_023179862.2 G protein-activated inward rectifier potassium channel 3 isoform X1 [Drosophila hydei]XP_023179863.2 G protein-activated inward rectifier potassium channel 3 isoform X1 [Drosophila hydei]